MQAPPGMPTLILVGFRVRHHLSRVSPRSWRNLLALATPFAMGLGLVLWSDASEVITPERIQAEVLALGGVGLIAYLAAAAVRPLFVVISGSLFAVAAGMVWGPWWGTVLALGGSFLSASIVFGLARLFGSGAVQELAGPKYTRFSNLCQAKGFAFVFIATLGFVFPTDVVIAVAATAGVRPRTVLTATTLGTTPGTIAMVVLGATVIRPTPATWWIGGVAVAGLTVLALILARLWLPRATGNAGGSSATA